MLGLEQKEDVREFCEELMVACGKSRGRLQCPANVTWLERIDSQPVWEVAGMPVLFSSRDGPGETVLDLIREIEAECCVYDSELGCSPPCCVLL